MRNITFCEKWCFRLFAENGYIFRSDFRLEKLIWVQFFFVKIKNNIQ